MSTWSTFCVYSILCVRNATILFSLTSVKIRFGWHLFVNHVFVANHRWIHQYIKTNATKSATIDAMASILCNFSLKMFVMYVLSNTHTNANVNTITSQCHLTFVTKCFGKFFVQWHHFHYEWICRLICAMVILYGCTIIENFKYVANLVQLWVERMKVYGFNEFQWKKDAESSL